MSSDNRLRRNKISLAIHTAMARPGLPFIPVTGRAHLPDGQHVMLSGHCDIENARFEMVAEAIPNTRPKGRR